MEEILKARLPTKRLVATGESGSGCISSGEAYTTDVGKVFVKTNNKSEAKVMFDGEMASLLAIGETNTIRVPKPLVSANLPAGGAILAMEHVTMRPLGKYAILLGRQLSALHLNNETLLQKYDAKELNEANNSPVTKFGFSCTTCCGYLPQDNSWQDDWVVFYCKQKLKPQIERIQSEYGDKEIGKLWTELEPKIPQFFEGIEVKPALLHGDLWGGNVAETVDGPVIFDPASFYGHSEFEMAIATMFGGFTREFFRAYHEAIPKADGFKKRQELYQLFHYLNHWNHFGAGYRGSSLSTMRKLLAYF